MLPVNPQITNLSIHAAHPGRRSEAAALAVALGVVLVEQLPESGQVLVLNNIRTELRTLGKNAPGPVYVDFVEGVVAHRRKFGADRGQLLSKAAGLKGTYLPDVIDATAGFGKDGFVLASLGCQVRLIERSPLAGALLADGLRRARNNPEIREIIGRMSLTKGDAIVCLAELAEQRAPDVVVLDPMFPDPEKGALVKKEMLALQTFVGEDLDAPMLLTAALAVAQRRVIVKRPIGAPPIEGPKPSVEIVGGGTRFDVYVAA